MHKYLLIVIMLVCSAGYAQRVNTTGVSSQDNSQNIYSIKQHFLQDVLHNPVDKNVEATDNQLQQFNRWFNFMEPRCYPTGNLPKMGVMQTESNFLRKSVQKTNKTTSAGTAWTSIGPSGLGRINCVVLDPTDTGTIFVGAACGGVWISHNSGTTWTCTTDTFPSISIADIAVNPHHHDTVYAATGDGYGYVPGSESMFDIFWGGLYSGGVMMSADGGTTWHHTGLGYVQTDTNIIQKLLIHPNHPNILLAATRKGIYRTVDAGITWSLVDTGHVFSMSFKPLSPDTIYAVNTSDLHVSYNAGATWSLLYSGINTVGTMGSRCSIGTTPSATNNVYVIDANNNLQLSTDGGHTFSTTSTSPYSTANFYGYYDRVLAVAPDDYYFVLAAGMSMASSGDEGNSWTNFDPSYWVHPDNHALTFNPLNTNIIYSGNDGGVFVTRDRGSSWTNITTGLTIAQIYKMNSSRQTPNMMLCGLQDNGTQYNDGSNWGPSTSSMGDGMDCKIFSGNDYYQITSYQYGHFSLSTDQGASFSMLPAPESGYWTTPVLFSPNSQDTIYFGYRNMYASYDGGSTMTQLTYDSPFGLLGAVSMAIAPSNTGIIYAADFSHIKLTTDFGVTWTDVTGSLPGGTCAITHIAVDYTNPMKVYVTTSGYIAGQKLYYSATGGTTWTNISNNLPNLPANCVALDSSTLGAIFVGTDMGVFYTDSSLTNWVLYNTGLPNVIVNDLEINYTNNKLRAATYGRGIWETDIRKALVNVPSITENGRSNTIQISPNPSKDRWILKFSNGKPADFRVKVMALDGMIISVSENKEVIDATQLTPGVYNIRVIAGSNCYNIKAVKGE